MSDDVPDFPPEVHHMEEMPNLPAGSRRNEDIALELMKFIAITTGYGKTGARTGFHGATETKPEDYAGHLLELYTRCLHTVSGKK